MTVSRDPNPSTDLAQLQGWVERMGLELLRAFGREGEIHSQAVGDPGVVTTYVWLPTEHKRLEGPAIPFGWIALEDGRRALTALTTFILLLPKRPGDRARADQGGGGG